MRKIEDLTFFSSTPSEQRGKTQKRPFQAPTDPVCLDRAYRGLFRQNGLKIEDGFTDIFGFQVRYFVLDRSGRWGRYFTSGLLIRFAAKRKMAETIFMAQPSLFFPYFDFTLMNVYMNTGIK